MPEEITNATPVVAWDDTKPVLTKHMAGSHCLDMMPHSSFF